MLSINAETTASATVNIASTPQISTTQAQEQSAEPQLSPAYTVEISSAGAQLSASEQASAATKTAATSQAATAPAGTLVPASPPSAAASAVQSADTTSSEMSETSDAASADLSQYSDAQLKTMLSNGEISQSAYNAELAKRKQEEQAAIENNVAGTSTFIDALGQ